MNKRTFIVHNNKIYDESLAKKEFGKEVITYTEHHVFTEMKKDAGGKSPWRVTFAAGSTGRTDIDDLAKIGLINALEAAFQPASEDWEMSRLAAFVDVEQDNQDLPVLLGGDDDLNEWIGERRSVRFVTDKPTVKTKTWEKTMYIERSALEDDKSGQLMRRIADFSNLVNGAKKRLIIKKYRDMATTTNWLSGQFMVDTDHTWPQSGGYSTAQSNKSTDAPSQSTLVSGVESMLGFLNYNGNAIPGNYPNVVLVPAKYWAEVGEAFNSPYYMHGDAGSTAAVMPGTGANPLNRQMQYPTLIVSADLNGTYDDYTFLIRNWGGVAPVLFCQRSDVPEEFVVRLDPETSDVAFHEDKAEIGYRGRFNLEYGPWYYVFGYIL